ncbi:MAG: hypothetical protein ACP5JZ_03420 [Thermosulfidibacteraceae bacterium]|jgi:hypothetical protein
MGRFSYDRKDGFVLITVIVLLSALLVLGITGLYLSRTDYLAQLSYIKYAYAEKTSETALNDIVRQLLEGNSCSNVSVNSTSGLISYNSLCKEYGNTYLIWSKGVYGNARVVKVAFIFKSLASSFYGAAVVRYLNSVSMGGSSSIESCDLSCPTSALVTGNDIGRYISTSTTCKNNNKGVVANGASPYLYINELLNTDLTPYYFSAKDRDDLLTKLSLLYNVKFSDGTPVGVASLNDPRCDLSNYNLSCSAGGSTLSCKGSINVNATWSGGSYLVTLGNSIVSCNALELGQNGRVTFSDFTGGGAISASNVNIAGSITPSGSLNIVARNSVSDVTGGYTLKNVNIFAQNISLDNQNFVISGGIIYSGGHGVGNLNIDVNGNTKMGTIDNPVLIVSDNNINISQNGNVDIYALVFATDRNNNLNVSGAGNYDVRGAIVSNSRLNNTINIGGNFGIIFDKTVLNNLAKEFPSLVKPVPCSSGVVTNPMLNVIMTKIQVY